MNLYGLTDSLSSVIGSPAKCEQCGATTRLGNGVCVSCLLCEGLEAEGEGSSEVFESIIAEIDFPDKQWRLGNYEILEEVGRGGMGVIYRARQRHSRRIVAVKRLLSYHADSHETLVRFRREAEAVASLDHPNILPIYEIGESEDGVPYFSMKFATGGSLQQASAALRSGPRQCVQLMAKVAHAIAYAHSQGILHRDLKPGNVLLDGCGEPLVSDFGLAKWLDANSDLTRSLTTFGTPGYIAPEQSEGAAADLTSAADVYSLGAVLFDLLTGRAPFLGTHALSVIRQAAETSAPKLRSLVRSLDRDLETICARCLERDPKARYHSAGDLATDLQRWLDGRPIIARPVSIPTRTWRWSQRNPRLVATAAAGLLFGAAALWLFRGQLGLTPPEKSIAVIPFENLNHDEESAAFTELMQDDIVTQLAQVAELKVVAGSSLQQYQSGTPHHLATIGRTLGVRNLLQGTVQRKNTRVLVTMQLTDASNGRLLWAEHYDRDLPQALNIQNETAEAIANQLHAKLSAAEKAELESRPAASEKSVELYRKAQRLAGVRAVGNQLKANLSKQELLLNEATELESGCIDAYRDLVELEINFLQTELQEGWDNGSEQEHAARAERALDNVVRLQPEAVETFRLQGIYHHDVIHDYDSARHYFDMALRTNPGGVELWLWAARCDRRRGHWDECLAELAKTGAPIWIARTNTMDLRRYAEAEQVLNRALATKPAVVPILYLRLGECRLAQGDPQGAKVFFERIPPQGRLDDEGKDDLTAALYLRDYRSANEWIATAPAQLLDSEVITDLAVCPRSMFAALVIRAQHGAEKAREAFAAARKEAEARWKWRATKPQQLSLLACMDAGAGRKDDAIQEAKHALELRPIAKDAVDGPYLATNLALVYAWTGERDLAIEQLEALAKIPCGPSYGDLKLNPKWDDLRGDPRFEQMVASLAPKL